MTAAQSSRGYPCTFRIESVWSSLEQFQVAVYSTSTTLQYFIQKESDGHCVARPFLGCIVTGSRVKRRVEGAVGHLLVGGHLNGPIFKYNRYLGTRYRLTSDIAKTKRYLRLSIISVSCISMSQAYSCGVLVAHPYHFRVNRFLSKH